MDNRIIIFLVLIGLFSNSCKNSGVTKQQEIEKEISAEPTNSNPTDISTFVEQSENDTLALKIKDYIRIKYPGIGDLGTIKENQRKFQLYQIDLNNDGNNEIFVNLINSYFCGTGGCTILLLNKDLELINKFTVIHTLYIEPSFQNDWKIIFTKSVGNWRKLIYENGNYPSNPSVVEPTSDSPSEVAKILFDDNYSKFKTYMF